VVVAVVSLRIADQVDEEAECGHDEAGDRGPPADERAAPPVLDRGRSGPC
jgi:hypothetical protein